MRTPRSHEQQSLVDIKGLGKPPTLKGESAKFTEWLKKTRGFLIAAYGTTFQSVIERVEDQDNFITNEALDRQFGPTGAEQVEDVQERSEPVHVALLALRESESFDIVLGAAPFRSRSVETVGPWLGLSERRKAQSSSATNLGSRSMHAGLEKWEELVRRYERSKSCGTTAAALDEGHQDSLT